ncbi:hypothetical protein [Pyruvatibacter mobilis]|uniref:hypothetical protein n=1 Tax=Pyruvatibacter mobilis TaxID=1712261 RepID=UPI003C7D57D6
MADRLTFPEPDAPCAPCAPHGCDAMAAAGSTLTPKTILTKTGSTTKTTGGTTV